MGKIITRILFIAFSAIIIFFTTIIFYNTSKGDHILKITNDALEAKDYKGVLELYGGLYNEVPVVKQEEGTNDLWLVTSATEKNFFYNNGNSSKDNLYHKFVKSYNLYMFNVVDLQTNNIKEAGKTKNLTGIKFITDKTDVSYIYPFIISSTVNNDNFAETHPTINATYVYETRDYLADKGKTGFFNIEISEDLIAAIESEVEANIVGFNIVNNDGISLYESDFNFEFNYDEEFYSDSQIGTIISAYEKFIPYYDSYKFGNKYNVADYIPNLSNEEYKKQITEFNEKMDTFTEGVRAGNVYDESLKLSLNDKEIFNSKVISSCVWRTIGVDALVLLVFAVIYVLLFHFKQLRDFIFRNEKRTPIRAKVVNKEPEVAAKPGFSYNQSGNKKKEIEAKPEAKSEAKPEVKEEAKPEVKEEKVEEVKDAEIVEENTEVAPEKETTENVNE